MLKLRQLSQQRLASVAALTDGVLGGKGSSQLSIRELASAKVADSIGGGLMRAKMTHSLLGAFQNDYVLRRTYHSLLQWE